MDDFKIVIGMDFLRQVRAVPIPFLRSMAILEEEAPCMVPTITESKAKTPMLLKEKWMRHGASRTWVLKLR